MISGYGVVTSLGLLVLVVSGPIFKKLYFIHPWLFFGGSITTISVLAYTYFQVAFSGTGASESFMQILLNTLIVGIVILLLLKGIFMSHPQRKDHSTPEIIRIPSRNKSCNGIQVPASNLILVEASGNYISVYYLHDNDLQKKLIRNTMKNIEGLITHGNRLVRCHMSFIVNTDYVLETTRKNRRHFMKLRYISTKVPVSERYYPRINERLGESVT